MGKKVKYKYQINCYYLHDELDECHHLQSRDGAIYEALYLARFYDKVRVYFVGGMKPELIEEYININGRIKSTKEEDDGK